MKKKILTAIIATTLLATSFGGIGNVQAADGDHTPKKENWSNPTGNTKAYYEFDFVRALAKEDTKTALEAMDYWIDRSEQLGAYQDKLDKLNYYRDEVEKGVIHFHIGDMMVSGADIAYSNLIQKIERGELPRYTYVEYDKFHTKADETLGDHYDNVGDNSETPSDDEINNSDIVENSDTATEEKTLSAYKAPYGKTKPINTYVKELDYISQNSYFKIEQIVQSILKSKLIPLLNSYDDEKLKWVMPAFEREIDKRINDTNSLRIKVILEEIKIQTKLEVRDY